MKIHKTHTLFLLISLFKLVILCIFSSAFFSDLFYPFVDFFNSTLNNPYQYFLDNHHSDTFPYHALMLYILSPFVALANMLDIQALAKIVLFLADIAIFICFLRLFKHKIKDIYIYIYANPIIIYATYIHSQLDIIPSAFLLWAIYCLIHRFYKTCFLLFGLSLACKFHILLAAPLILIYLFKQKLFKEIALFCAIVFSTLLILDMPFLFSDGFIEMVLFNDKNSLIFDSAFAIGKLNLLLPILSILIIYMHFFNQAKINNDLLFFYFGILFACILLLVYPSPAWYLWAIPFICIYFINAKNFNKALMLYITFSFAYLVFFIFFYHGDYADIYVLNKPLNLKIEHKNLSDISYTILESILLCIIYVFYKHGIKSNSIYKRKQNLSIGIGGDSGAGKSTLLNLLKNMLGDRLLCLEGDGEHKWERGNSAWEKFTHLDPKANLLHNQSDFITELKNNNAIYRRDYDHTSGKFSTPQLLKPKPFLVIAGLHPFYLPKMRKSLDLKIYLDTDENLRIHWKILRDKARGHSKKSVELAIAKREQDKQKYITPQKAFSDLIISFSTQEAIEIGNKNTKINLALHITLNASVNLAPLLEVLVCEWDYNNDLKTQFLLLKSQPNLDFNALALQMIENINEITENLSLPSGYDGLIGLIILILIAQNLKDEQ